MLKRLGKFGKLNKNCLKHQK